MTRLLPWCLLFVSLALPASAQEDGAPEVAQTATEQLPEDPGERLELAQDAFRRADYRVLVPLLEPLDEAPERLPVDARVAARELLVVGYYFLAQQVTTHTDRDDYLRKARGAALSMLRDKPEHALDSLVFPVSVVDLVEEVRRENAEELNELIATRHPNGVGETQTIYLERQVQRHAKWVNLLPFAAGQFQNGDLVKGTSFAILQGAGLALNAVSYWNILRLRDPSTGRYSSDGGQSSNLAKARRWRQALYGGLGTFAATWIVSAIDGWVNHESEVVRIRTLDTPPPELNAPIGGVRSDAGLHNLLELGLSVEFRW